MDIQAKRRKRVLLGFRKSAVIAATLLAAGPIVAQADTISFVNQFKNVGNLQTGNGNTLSSNGAFYSSSLTSTNGTFTTVTMTYPGAGSPASLSNTAGDPTFYLFQTSSFANQAAMDAALPFGAYQFNASGSGTGSTSYSYTANDYAQSLPYLAGTDYAALQGMDPSHDFTLHLSPFTTGGAASESFIFVTIFDQTKGMNVYNQGFLSSTTTTLDLPANTLAFGDSFTYEIDFSNRDLVASPGAAFSAQLGFDVRTDGNFTTAASLAPEPGALGLLASGVIAGYLLRRKARG